MVTLGLGEARAVGGSILATAELRFRRTAGSGCPVAVARHSVIWITSLGATGHDVNPGESVKLGISDE